MYEQGRETEEWKEPELEMDMVSPPIKYDSDDEQKHRGYSFAESRGSSVKRMAT